MSNEIQKLKDMLSSDAKVSLILRQALVVAYKHDKNAIFWITEELNGYAKTSKVPEYRIVNGEPRAKQIYTGMSIPFQAHTKKIQNIISKRNLPNSIAELEILINPQKGEEVFIPFPQSLQIQFAKETNSENFQFVLSTTKHSLHRILENVKTRLLEWVIELDDTENDSNATLPNSAPLSNAIFPKDLFSQLPEDVALLADDFNFNFSDKRAYPCMLILRRMLPLAIVRRFQMDNKEQDIKGKDGDYLSPHYLLNKAKPLVINKNAHKDVEASKMLLDASQHSYTFQPELSEVNRTAIALRLFLEELFPKQEK